MAYFYFFLLIVNAGLQEFYVSEVAHLVTTLQHKSRCYKVEIRIIGNGVAVPSDNNEDLQ